MNPSEVASSIKKLLFSEPRFIQYLEESSHRVCSPFDLWVNDDSDEYTKYLNTGATIADNSNEVHNKVMQNMSDFRDKTLLTYLTKCFEERNTSFNDMEILVEDSVYKVHRLIVAPFIPIVRDYLLTTPQESQANGVTVDLKGISKKSSVECLIEYIYTGKVKPTPDNFLDVLELSINCRMQNFAEKWIEAFDSTKPLRVLKFLFRCRLARRYQWNEYVARLNKAMALEFENLMLTDKFLRLTATELCDIIGEDEIGTSNEIIVFLGALKWLNYDWSRRKKYAVQLMQEIRLHQMNKDELEACMSPPISPELMDTDEIKSMIIDVLNNRIDRNRQKRRIYRKTGAPSLKLWTYKISDSRKLISEVNDLQDNLESKKAKTSDLDAFERKQWTVADGKKSSIAEQNIKRLQFSQDKYMLKDTRESKPKQIRTKIDFKIDLSGKDVQKDAEEEEEAPKTKKKQILSKEKEESEASVSLATATATPDSVTRASQRVVDTLRKHIHREAAVTLIVFSDYYYSAEAAFIFRCDDMSLTTWKKYNKLPNNFKIPLDAVVVSDSKKIYFVGGIEYKRSKHKDLSLLACHKFYKYDLKVNKLKKLKEMSDARVLHSAVFLNKRLYVVGGLFKKNTILNTIEFFDFGEKKWQRIDAEMQTPRYGCACTVIKKRLFIFGGISQTQEAEKYLLNDVIVYNPVRNTWLKMKKPLPVPIAYCSVVYHRKMIYVIGGRVTTPGAAQLMMSGKVYRFNQTEWEELQPLNNPRCHIFCFAHNTKIFAIGGCTDEEGPVSVAEIMDTYATEKGWTVVDKLPFKTTGNMMTTVRTDVIGH